MTYCEDFDDPEFTASTGTGNWVAGGSNRGGSSLWATRYGNGVTAAIWQLNQPSASPTFGSQCTAGSFCSGMKVWDEADRWQANSFSPSVHIMDGASDFTAEDATAGTPTIEGSSGSSILGNALFGYRNGPGIVGGGDFGSGGILNSIAGIGGTLSQLGYTSLWGYDARVKDYQILDDAWKHDEVIGVRGGASNGLLGFRSTGYDPVADQSNSRYTFPAHMFVFTEDFSCITALSGAVRTVGRAYCDAADNIQIESSLSVFNFNTDWDLTKHHCVSIYADFRTISSVDVKMWIDGEVVLNVSNMDWTGSKYDSVAGVDGVSSLSMNNYSNRSNLSSNASGGHANEGPRPGANRRYVDNKTIVNGTPQLCSKIGFPTSYNQAGL